MKFGDTSVTVHGDWVDVVLPDGAQVEAMPNFDGESVARAESLGYNGDVWAMTAEHDAMHAQLAHALGLPESHVLRCVAAGVDSGDLGNAEECLVLAAQRFLNLYHWMQRDCIII